MHAYAPERIHLVTGRSAETPATHPWEIQHMPGFQVRTFACNPPSPREHEPDSRIGCLAVTFLRQSAPLSV
jgi:hypothetical protein